MPQMPESRVLRDILERVQKATWADRGIDCDLYPLLADDAEQADLMRRVVEHWRESNDLDCVPRYTASIDAALALVERLLPGWWWTCGTCVLSNDASIAPAGSRAIGPGLVVNASLGPDFRAGPEMQALLKSNPVFDEGFNGDRIGGNVPLAILDALLSAIIAQSGDAG